MISAFKISTLVLAFAVLQNSCIKEEPDPNEDWSAGKDWIDARDGQSYATVRIGNQVWMAENFNFGADSGSWVYDNNINNAVTYGRLYDWETAVKVCPDGWHLPLREEWDILIEKLGGSEIAGGKMKEIGTSHWEDPNTGATNSSQFSALPGGYRWSENEYIDVGMHSHFWSSSKSKTDYTITYILGSYFPQIIDNTLYTKGCACSVRYIKN
jgi:uncharacterized protein (TIGR02145 family)